MTEMVVVQKLFFPLIEILEGHNKYFNCLCFLGLITQQSGMVIRQSCLFSAELIRI